MSFSSDSYPSTLATRLSFFSFFFDALTVDLFDLLLGLDEDMMRRIEFGEEEGFRDKIFERKIDIEV